jgi:hypothetical protein
MNYLKMVDDLGILCLSKFDGLRKSTLLMMMERSFTMLSSGIKILKLRWEGKNWWTCHHVYERDIIGCGNTEITASVPFLPVFKF